MDMVTNISVYNFLSIQNILDILSIYLLLHRKTLLFFKNLSKPFCWYSIKCWNYCLFTWFKSEISYFSSKSRVMDIFWFKSFFFIFTREIFSRCNVFVFRFLNSYVKKSSIGSVYLSTGPPDPLVMLSEKNK